MVFLAIEEQSHVVAFLEANVDGSTGPSVVCGGDETVSNVVFVEADKGDYDLNGVMTVAEGDATGL